MQLKAQGLIDYLSFSIFTKNSASSHSTIKFGGYDDDGLAKNRQLTILKTIDATTWAVWGEDIQLGDLSLSKKIKGYKRRVIFEPQFPYMHIPHEDFASISGIIATIYKDSPVHCKSKTGECYFSQRCE